MQVQYDVDPPSYSSLVFSRPGERPQTQPLVANAPAESGQGSPSVSYHPTSGARRDVSIRLPSATAGRQGQPGNNTQSNVQLNARHARPVNNLNFACCTKKTAPKIAFAGIMGLALMVMSFGSMWYSKDQLLNNIHDSDKKNGASLYTPLTRGMHNENVAEVFFILGSVCAAIAMFTFFVRASEDMPRS